MKVIATETVVVTVAMTEIEIDTVPVVVKNILLQVIQNDLAVKVQVKKRPKSDVLSHF